MKNKAYLTTLTNKEFRSGRAAKYKIIDVIIKQMVAKAIKKPLCERHCKSEGNFTLIKLNNFEAINVVDEFFTAFADILDTDIKGLLKMESRFFKNWGGIEISVTTLQEDHYTIFVSIPVVGLMRATIRACGRDPFKDDKKMTDSEMAVFRQIRKMDHYFFFPTLEHVRKTTK